MTRIVLAFAALAITAFPAFATEPITPPQPAAHWDGDFSVTNGGFVLNAGYESVLTDNSAVKITHADTGLLVNFERKRGYSKFTVLVKYANLAKDNSTTNILFAATSNTNLQFDTNGVLLGPARYIAGFITRDKRIGSNYGEESQEELNIPETGIVAVVYNTGSGWSVYSAGAGGKFSDTNSWNASNLIDGNMRGISVGGHCVGTQWTGTQAAQGMEISGLAIFTNILTVAEMNAYRWPNSQHVYQIKDVQDWFVSNEVFTVDTHVNNPIVYEPPSYSGDSTSYRIETVIKSLCVHASTNSLPVGNEWGEKAPFAAIVAAVDDESSTNWYCWAGSEWASLGGEPVPADGNSYTNAIEFAVEDGELKARFYVNSDDSPIGELTCVTQSVAMTELPLNPKLGFAGFGEFQRYIGKGIAKLTLTTMLSEDQLAGLVVTNEECATIEKALVKHWGNNLAAWQNIVLGILKADADAGKMPFAAPVQNSNANALSFSVGHCAPNDIMGGVTAKFKVYEVDERGNEIKDGEGLVSGVAMLGEEAKISTDDITSVKYFKLRIRFEQQ